MQLWPARRQHEAASQPPGAFGAASNRAAESTRGGRALPAQLASAQGEPPRARTVPGAGAGTPPAKSAMPAADDPAPHAETHMAHAMQMQLQQPFSSSTDLL